MLICIQKNEFENYVSKLWPFFVMAFMCEFTITDQMLIISWIIFCEIRLLDENFHKINPFNLSGAGTGIFQEYLVNNMGADALVQHMTWSAEAMILVLYDEQVTVFYEDRF